LPRWNFRRQGADSRAMRRLAFGVVLLGGCFEDAPPEMDECDFTCADGRCAVLVDGVLDCSPDVGESSSSEGGSSSTGEPVEPYGPCESNDDCPIIEGPGNVTDKTECYQGTCAYWCGEDPTFCPLYGGSAVNTVSTCRDGWCSLLLEPCATGPQCRCPDGMEPGYPDNNPHQACVWEPVS
jgi:hypothetical protein